jgi:hypothetical protein
MQQVSAQSGRSHRGLATVVVLTEQLWNQTEAEKLVVPNNQQGNETTMNRLPTIALAMFFALGSTLALA